mmetsp:Transcript_17018/g.35781  ORF Transcript_17018/g.35781 Transcript_17018/m.35781 type:complete len:137 (+) Transcript_17018:227-637(+)
MKPLALCFRCPIDPAIQTKWYRNTTSLFVLEIFRVPSQSSNDQLKLPKESILVPPDHNSRQTPEPSIRSSKGNGYNNRIQLSELIQTQRELSSPSPPPSCECDFHPAAIFALAVVIVGFLATPSCRGSIQYYPMVR